ncbi:hypothetical protein [Longimicrobium sp.]|uniref:hypothetical protein n=1 Tax=Longimicrobium sp. TaxID=2029185 RepID=UPI002E3493D6|nr:hypothetical protein [Longimicrobium sp.]HEX6038207.1 hypothetical protein [Longimicrobium sp.]
MKKLRLSLDELTVDSFQTGDDEALQRGTVHGNASDSTCFQRICECREPSEYNQSCGTCDYDEDTCYYGCATYLNCPTNQYYPGC